MMYQVTDLHLSLPDMTRKPLVGAAPRIHILKGLTFDVPKGAVLGIVGGRVLASRPLGARCCGCLNRRQDRLYLTGQMFRT
ncbi:hypothetical protein [Sulfitobacter aestuariivivens]|uniref:hypothetical protein n=1 Tax=Sulfitobacter aestuariivivens TaxID=2766981 RepID=UPI00361283D2